MILDKTYIHEQDLTTCQQLLEQCLANPKIHLELVKHPNLFAECEDLANTICYLEDRIQRLVMEASVGKAMEASLKARQLKYGKDPELEQDID